MRLEREKTPEFAAPGLPTMLIKGIAMLDLNCSPPAPHLKSWSQEHTRPTSRPCQEFDRSYGPSTTVWQVSPLSADERVELARLFDEKASEYGARVEAHAETLGSIAYRLGRNVSATRSDES